MYNTRESVRTNLVHWMSRINRPQLQATELLRPGFVCSTDEF